MCFCAHASTHARARACACTLATAPNSVHQQIAPLTVTAPDQCAQRPHRSALEARRARPAWLEERRADLERYLGRLAAHSTVRNSEVGASLHPTVLRCLEMGSGALVCVRVRLCVCYGGGGGEPSVTVPELHLRTLCSLPGVPCVPEPARGCACVTRVGQASAPTRQQWQPAPQHSAPLQAGATTPYSNEFGVDWG